MVIFAIFETLFWNASKLSLILFSEDRSTSDSLADSSWNLVQLALLKFHLEICVFGAQDVRLWWVNAVLQKICTNSMGQMWQQAVL